MRMGGGGGGMAGVRVKSSKGSLFAIIFNKIKMFAQSVCGTCLTVRQHTTKKKICQASYQMEQVCAKGVGFG